jgi:hypothetical protein
MVAIHFTPASLGSRCGTTGRLGRFEEARKLKQSGPAAFGFGPPTEDRHETEEDDEYAALAEKYNVPFDDDEDDDV